MAKPPLLDGMDIVTGSDVEVAKERGFIIVSFDHLSSRGGKAYTRFYVKAGDALDLARHIKDAASEASKSVL